MLLTVADFGGRFLATASVLCCCAHAACLGGKQLWQNAAALLEYRYMTRQTSRGLLTAFFAAQVPLLLAERWLGALLR